MEIRLGESIRNLRKTAGFTQEQLSEALGVTPGAVHKWEAGKATPELELLVDIAEFFGTSIDAMLNYGWQKLNMGQTAEEISTYKNERKFEEGFRFAERALQKYPNSFEVVYQSALLYFMSTFIYRGKSARRAIELFEKAIELSIAEYFCFVSLIALSSRSQKSSTIFRSSIKCPPSETKGKSFHILSSIFLSLVTKKLYQYKLNRTDIFFIPSYDGKQPYRTRNKACKADYLPEIHKKNYVFLCGKFIVSEKFKNKTTCTEQNQAEGIYASPDIFF